MIRAAGGNPLFAIELARSLTLDGGLDGSPVIKAPESLQSLLSDRLAALSPGVRRVVCVVAASSRGSEATISKAAGREGPAALARALDDGVLVRRSGQVELMHPLLGSIALPPVLQQDPA